MAVDNDIHRINHYPADSAACQACFVNTYPQLDSDLSRWIGLSRFEQQGPDLSSWFSAIHTEKIVFDFRPWVLSFRFAYLAKRCREKFCRFAYMLALYCGFVFFNLTYE